MMGVNVINGWPSHTGNTIGELCMDIQTSNLYVWNNGIWNDIGMMGPAGPQGTPGVPADDTLLKGAITELQKVSEDIDLVSRVMELHIIGAIDSKKYMNLHKMMKAEDVENKKLALNIIDGLYEKHFE